MVADYNISTNNNRLQQKLEKSTAIEDVDLQGDFNQYLCIRISAHYEQSVKQYLLQYVAQNSGESLNQLVQKRILRRQSSFKFDVLSQLLGDITEPLQQAFKQRITQETKDAIAALIKNRNQLAHGGNTSIGQRNLTLWLTEVSNLLKCLAEVLNITGTTTD